jgi:hypothetical protein
LFLRVKEPNTTDAECSLKGKDGILIGVGMAKQGGKLTRVTVGVPENSINAVVNVASEEKIIILIK